MKFNPEKLSYAPLQVDKDTWYYEKRSGIDVHHNEGGIHVSFIIPIRKLKATLRRHDKASGRYLL